LEHNGRCQHIALATVYRADVLVSWNFKHIVNLERIIGYISINFREGYQMIEIRTPKKYSNMKTEKKTKSMVQRMREIREKVSQEIINLSLEDEKKFIEKRLNELKKKKGDR
jgi:hypothetical protein